MISKESMKKLWMWASWVNTFNVRFGIDEGLNKARELVEIIEDSPPEERGTEFQELVKSYEATGTKEFANPELRHKWEKMVWQVYDRFLTLHSEDEKFREEQAKEDECDEKPS